MTKAKLTQVFFQANTVKGYRYLDDAGKIMNRWNSDFPNMEVGIDGLLMSNTNAIMRQIRVDTKNIWIHFLLPKRIREVIELAKNITIEICEIIDVKQFDRLGLRVAYIYETDNLEEAANIIANTSLEPSFRSSVVGDNPQPGLGINIPILTTEVSVNMRISTVKKATAVQSLTDLPDMGVMLDSDIFVKTTSYMDDLNRFIKSAQKWIEEDFPKIENIVLGGN